VGLALGMHLEAILVSHLTLADLAVPSQPLKSLGLELVVEILRRSYLNFRDLNCGGAIDVVEEDEAGGVFPQPKLNPKWIPLSFTILKTHFALFITDILHQHSTQIDVVLPRISESI
jgi:hypothetical protein